MSLNELEDFAMINGFSEFFSAGFRGREPEWVEALRYGDVPECGFSINYADDVREPGVSCIKLLRKADDERYNSIYDITLGIGSSRKNSMLGVGILVELDQTENRAYGFKMKRQNCSTEINYFI